MSRVAIAIPKIGLVMETVRIARWLKVVGDAVKIGEPLLEVETEKSVVEIEAAGSGHLAEILAPVGQEAKVGDRIAWLDSDQAESAPAAPPEKPIQNRATARVMPTADAKPAQGRTPSSPAARRLIAEQSLDLRSITGSGPGGRVQLADVRRTLAANESAGGPPVAPAGGGMSPMQRALARAMVLSNATVPQFTVERALDCSTLVGLRTEYNAGKAPHQPGISVTDFLLQALARALIEFPPMNATYSGGEDFSKASIVPAGVTRIGLVVAAGHGLLVPVLRNAEQLGLRELAQRRSECVERALAGRLRQEELTGATCSLSNLGAAGPDRFAAMINPPESAILAVGRQRDCVIARAGGFAVRPMSDLTLTVDHRVASGRLAAEFLGRLVTILESPDWRP